MKEKSEKSYKNKVGGIIYSIKWVLLWMFCVFSGDF
jgi:hypothetical protein